MQPRNQALANMGYAWRIIVATRAASIIAAALVLIGSISQFRDVIRFLLEQKAPGGLLALCVSSAALSLALWYSARVLIYQIEPELMLNQTARLKLQLKSAHSDYVVCWANNYPRLLGLAPFVALLIGSWTSMAVNQWQIWLFRGIVMALGIVIYVFEYLRRQLYLKNDDEERDLASLTRKKETAGTAVPLTTTELRKALIIIVTANVLMSILMLCTVCTKGHWAVYMGTIPTMFSALAFLVIFTSGITLGRRI